jgi:hypothetical protein
MCSLSKILYRSGRNDADASLIRCFPALFSRRDIDFFGLYRFPLGNDNFKHAMI